LNAERAVSSTAHPIREAFSLAASIARYRAFESLLAEVQAKAGIIPKEAAAGIGRGLARATIDEAALQRAVEGTGYPIAPLVRQLTDQCGEDGAWLHWGTTTQDLLITVRAQQIDFALRLVGGHLAALIERVAELSSEHRHTLMPARSFGGHAGVTTFGAHCATWLASLLRHAERLIDLLRRPAPGELFGAVGTLASMGVGALDVQRDLMARLRVPAPLASASSARDASAEAVMYLALLAATLGKIAQDVAQSSATEIGELAEPTTGGRDASSALPHKANPILSWQVMNGADVLESLVGLALRAMRQDQHRGGIGMLEHEVVPQAFERMERCLEASRTLLRGLRVFPERMRANCDMTQGLALSESIQVALGPHIGRLAAHDLVHRACMQAMATGRSLFAVLQQMPEVRAHLDEAALTTLLAPQGQLGASEKIVERCLMAARSGLATLEWTLKSDPSVAAARRVE
jgi:3-carboxy-cis,cis-muconate cycloisomerase